MAQRPASKRIHYVRAVYSQGSHPGQTLEQLLRGAYRILPSVHSTSITVSTIGVLATRHRTISSRYLKLTIGGGAPGESMSTMGFSTTGDVDADLVNAPPANRAYKLADAFCLVDGDEVLAILDGMRLGSVERYFRQLLGEANLPAQYSAFELRPVGNADKSDVLGQEGVKELILTGTAYAASEVLRADGANSASSAIDNLWSELTAQVRAVFETQTRSSRKREELAQNFGDLNIVTTIKARGGSRADPLIIQSLQGVAIDIVDDSDREMQIKIKTNEGSTVTPTDLVLGKFVTLMRQDSRNDFSSVDVFTEISQYRSELVQQGRWQR